MLSARATSLLLGVLILLRVLVLEVLGSLDWLDVDVLDGLDVLSSALAVSSQTCGNNISKSADARLVARVERFTCMKHTEVEISDRSWTLLISSSLTPELKGPIAVQCPFSRDASFALSQQSIKLR